MIEQVCLAIIIVLFLFGSGCILFSIFFEKDHTTKYESLPKKKITKVEDVNLYFNDVEEVLDLDEGLLE